MTLYINYDHINFIKFLNSQKRVVFNFDYPVKILQKNGQSIVIADYHYEDLQTKAAYDAYCDRVRKAIANRASFETIVNNNETYEVVNCSKIASIKCIEKNNKLRLIINFANTVSFTDLNGNQLLTSDFLMKDYDTQSECDKILNKLVKHFK